MIDKEEAIQIARDLAEREGWVADDPEIARQMRWSVIDPVIVETDTRNDEPVFIVKTNVNLFDGSTHIIISRDTGNILSVFTPSP